MAVLWRGKSGGRSYEVRSAGRTRRLYIDGLLNTQYNPRTLFGGSLWDLLSVPALFAPRLPSRVLVLGVGGGTVIHQLHTLVRPERIVGVELAAISLRIARQFFDLDFPQLRLERADARAWLANWRGAPFDLIVDDLYAEEAGEPVRAVPADTRWCELILRNLSTHGVAVFNHIGPEEAAASAAVRVARVRKRFAAALELTGPRFENAVLALYRQPLTARPSRRGLEARLAARGIRSTAKLQFALRQLF